MGIVKEMLLRGFLLLIVAPWSYFFGFVGGLYFNFSPNNANLVGIVVALYIAFKAVAPWGKSRVTVGDVINKWSNLNDDIRRESEKLNKR